jgi:hypothetical protein
MAKSASPSYEDPKENVAEKKVLPPSKARAGLMDSQTLYVMGIGTVLTIAFFAAIFYVYFRGF